MGLASLGFDKSKTTSTSSSFDNLDQWGLNVGGSESSQDIAFRDIFQNLFSGAAATAAGIDTGALTGAANLLFSSGSGFLDTLQGGGPGADYLKSQLDESGSLVNEQLQLLQSDLGEFLNEQVLPGIKSAGVETMGLGGGRDQVARGIAGKGAIQEFTRGALGIRQGERDRMAGIAQTLQQNQTAAATSALQNLPQLYGLAEAGSSSALSPFERLAAILGGPTVLGESSSFDFGYDSTIGRAGSQSSTVSKKSGFKIGF